MANKNPWLGLASYEEPKNDNSDYKFCGRDEETMEVVRLIDNNLFITLYGSSGIGKTSLLKSGVIPILRKRDYYPVYIRLSQEPTELSYAEAIIKRLIDSGLREERSVKLENPDGNDRLYLWNYFATTRWINSDGNEVYPVMILDQFEEVFRDADKKKAELLLKQMYLLLNDELEMPDEEGYSADTNYRFVASIREDFLFVLEDSIDAFGLDLYKSNRYRLRAMKPENARQVVLVPGRDCIEESEKDNVADRILKLAKKPQSDDIDTLLLSLVCAGTFDKKIGDKITLGDLSIWKDNPMQVYYQDAVKTLNANQIRYIQQNLIREDGSRRRVDVKDLKEALGDIDFRKLVEGKNRLFSIGDKGQAELLHDKLAMAVYEERKAFEESERKKKFRRRISVVGVVVIAIAVVFFFQNWNLKKKDWKMMEIQSMFVGEKILDLSNLDSELAMKLAVEILPQNVDNPVDRPYTIEAEAALREAANYEVRIYKCTDYRVITDLSSDDSNILALDPIKNKIMIIDAETGENIQEWETEASLTMYSPDDKKILYYDDNEKMIIKSIETGYNVLEYKLEYKDDAIFPIYSPDGNNILYNTNNKIIIRNIESGAIIKEWEETVNFAIFSPDGNNILYNTNNKIIIRNIESGAIIKEWEEMVGFAIFSPDGNNIIIFPEDSDNKIVFKNIKQSKDIHSFNTIFNVAAFSGRMISPDSKKVILLSETGKIKIVDIDTEQEIIEINGDNKQISYAGFSNDGEKIFSSSIDGTIRIFNLKSAYERYELTKHSEHVFSFCFNSKGDQFLSASFDGTVRKWDVETGEEIGIIVADTNSPCYSVSYSPNNKSIVLSSLVGKNGLTRVLDAETGDEKHLLDSCLAISVSYSPYLEQIVGIVSKDSTLRMWDAESGDEIRRLKLDGNYVSYSTDGKYIGCSLSDGTMLVLDENLQKEKVSVKAVNNKGNYFYLVSFSPDGKKILSAGGIINVWDIETGENVLSINADNRVICATYSPDGKYIVSVSEGDKTIRVWDAESGKQYISLYNKVVPLRVKFTLNGRYIIVSYEDGTIRQYDFPPLQELIDQTRERFKNRPLTDEEKKMYYLE